MRVVFSHKCLLIVHLDLDSVPLLIVHLEAHTYAQVATSFLLYTPTPTLSRNIFHICDLCQENNNLYQSNVGNEWCKKIKQTKMAFLNTSLKHIDNLGKTIPTV